MPLRAFKAAFLNRHLGWALRIGGIDESARQSDLSLTVAVGSPYWRAPEVPAVRNLSVSVQMSRQPGTLRVGMLVESV